jgi:hypothetical protein
MNFIIYITNWAEIAVQTITLKKFRLYQRVMAKKMEYNKKKGDPQWASLSSFMRLKKIFVLSMIS